MIVFKEGRDSSKHFPDKLNTHPGRRTVHHRGGYSGNVRDGAQIVGCRRPNVLGIASEQEKLSAEGQPLIDLVCLAVHSEDDPITAIRVRRAVNEIRAGAPFAVGVDVVDDDPLSENRIRRCYRP